VVAIAMGIYHDLVKIVSNPITEIRKNIRFLIPLLLGAAISLILFVVIFRLLFERFHQAILFLFVGLIAGNLPLIAKELRGYSVRWREVVGGIAAFAIALGLSLVSEGVGSSGETGVTIWEMALAGFLAGAVTFIPGMSISAILIVMGVFGPFILMMESLVRLQTTYLPHVIVLILCAVLGLVLTARGIKKVFKRVPALANACVLGFMSGTLIGIFIESLYAEDLYFHWGLGAIMLLAGAALSSIFILLGKHMNRGDGV